MSQILNSKNSTPPVTPEVIFENNIFVANNGDDTTGDGSLSKPLATLTGTGGALSRIISPSLTNSYLILDQRTGVITESNDLSLPPFCFFQGNKSARFNGNISLNIDLFSVITTAAYAGMGGYYSIGRDDAGTQCIIDFSSFSNSNPIQINFENVNEVNFKSGSIYTGNDDTGISFPFIIYENDFNTAGSTLLEVIWQSDRNIESGVLVRINNSFSQISSIKKSQGTVRSLTGVLCNGLSGMIGNPSDGLIDIDNTGGNNQQFMYIYGTNCSGTQVDFSFGITNTGASSIFLAFDAVTNYEIDSIDSTTNFFIQNTSISTNLNWFYNPVNYTPTAFTQDGTTIPSNWLDAQFKGIDVKLGQVSVYPPNFIYGFNIDWRSSDEIEFNQGMCVDSTNSVNIITTNPISVNKTVSGAGGLNTGVTFSNNGNYGIYLISDSTGVNSPSGIIDSNYGVNTQPSNYPTGYDTSRYLGNIKGSSSGANIMGFVETGQQNDRYRMWATGDTKLQVLTGGTATTSTSVDCSGAVSPLASQLIALDYILNIGSDNTNILNINDPVTTESFYNRSPGFSNLTSNMIRDGVPSLPLTSDLKFDYNLSVNTGGANVSFNVRGYLEII